MKLATVREVSSPEIDLCQSEMTLIHCHKGFILAIERFSVFTICNAISKYHTTPTSRQNVLQYPFNIRSNKITHFISKYMYD